jgi:hypothetical protein
MSKVIRCSKCKKCYRTINKGKICKLCKVDVDSKFFNSSAGKWFVNTIIRGGYWSAIEYTTQDDLIALMKLHKKRSVYCGWSFDAEQDGWSSINKLHISHLYPVKGDALGVLHVDNLVIAPADINQKQGNKVFDVGIAIERYDPVLTYAGKAVMKIIRRRLKEKYDLKAVVKECKLTPGKDADPVASFRCVNSFNEWEILNNEATRLGFRTWVGRYNNMITKQFEALLKGELPSSAPL